jgi:predicted alpha/beta hydrolase family esterase
MKKVFIVHGFNGEPNGGWMPWLMGELAKKNIYACALPMPTPNDPRKEEWVETIKNVIKDPNEEIFLVGYSLGVPAILRYLEGLKDGEKIGGAVLLSGPFNIIIRDGYNSVNGFLDGPFNFEHIKKVCEKFLIIHGDNDKSVPFSDAEIFSKELSGELIPISNGGHLGGRDGFYKLPELVDSLVKMIL